MLLDKQISAMLVVEIAKRSFPSAVYVVGAGGELIFADAIGHAICEPENQLATLDTIYDAASLTKPLVTGLLYAKLIDRGEIELDKRASFYLQEFNQADKHSITLRQLLTHSSGLPAWRPLYALTESKEQVLKLIVDQPLAYEPGTRVVYSDLGFITLGLLLERLFNSNLAEIAKLEIFEPLNLKQTLFNPDISLRTSIAASESSGNCYERDMCKDEDLKGYNGWRDQLIWGDVHDGNAYFLGGVAGHAGLFSTAKEIARIAQEFIPTRSTLLSARVCELFQLNMTPGLEEDRSLAWQLASTKNSTAGPDLPKNSFGHTGFTGTSCWIDAAHERVFVLLTNRTHARKLPFENINEIRRRFHSLAVTSLDQLNQ
jgi:serine-type D-Ala-D-Ala carboxypeptidase